ncbi:cell division protein ZapE [Paracoccus aerodenitrificans]|uniref:cell division protein ZapE n=1 Tax=Paracoccus aerodenitrificans TaxID=3017781 RepID=UPI0022EFF879|nr:cell division protein ZapE [Paracoccus aerodenitrificans]WBU62995.1 cell division protein ZapE [Paracoccus aerodenitrificans]
MPSVTELYDALVASGQLKEDAAQREVLPVLDDLVATLKEEAPAPSRSGWRSWFGGQDETAPEGVRGLYLWGGVGRGKSMLMDLVMEAAPIDAKRRVHFHEFVQEIQSGLNEVRKRGERDAIRPVANAVADKARLLCFDEMQITDIADAMIVGRLFQVLFERGVCIVTTSNRVPEDLYKNGLNRQRFVPFIGLIRERMEVHALDSENDHRQGRAGGDQVWFSPLNRETRAEIDAVWKELTGDRQTSPLVLEVQGRKVEIPEHLDRMGRTGFWELCGKALGPADYLTLAKAVDLLVLEDIPLLSSSNFNEAKRFVTLIDALYEAKIRVIASAAAEPEALYLEGEGSFEFERTASRLREMQDARWGSDPGQGQDA